VERDQKRRKFLKTLSEEVRENSLCEFSLIFSKLKKKKKKKNLEKKNKKKISI